MHSSIPMAHLRVSLIRATSVTSTPRLPLGRGTPNAAELPWRLPAPRAEPALGRRRAPLPTAETVSRAGAKTACGKIPHVLAAEVKFGAVDPSSLSSAGLDYRGCVIDARGC